MKSAPFHKKTLFIFSIFIIAKFAYCAKPAEWDRERVYRTGESVLFDARLYVARWWNRGKEPISTESRNSPWSLVSEGGIIDGDSIEAEREVPDSSQWESVRVYRKGDVVIYGGERYIARWWNRDKAPSSGERGVLGPWLPIAGDGNVAMSAGESGEDGSVETGQAEESTIERVPERESRPDESPDEISSTEEGASNSNDSEQMEGSNHISVLDMLSDDDWDWFFPFRYGHYNPQGSTYNIGTEACLQLGKEGDTESNPDCDIYSLENFRKALTLYNSYALKNRKEAFLSSTDIELQIDELAAFLSNISRETSGTWPSAPVRSGGWIEDDESISMRVWKGGLYWIEEIGHSSAPDGSVVEGGVSYAVDSTLYPPFPERSYHGRGPIQLSWNYNYGAFGEWLYESGILPDIVVERDTLLKNPALVSKNGVVAFLSAIWFWMTPQGVKPSAHDVICGRLKEPDGKRSLPQRNDGGDIPFAEGSSGDREVLAYRFGATIDLINGGIECDGASRYHPGPAQRVSYFEAYLRYLDMITGTGLLTLGVGYMVQERAPFDSMLKEFATCNIMKSY